MRVLRESRNHKAFTLIELLVVIGILSLLAAILFPVFSRARENGRRSACQSNLKQIALGITQYTQDSDGHYPYGNLTGSVVGRGWSGTLQPYLRATQIFRCPSDTTTNSDTSYGYNSNLTATGDTAIQGSGAAAPQSALQGVSSTVLLFEIRGGLIDGYFESVIPGETESTAGNGTSAMLSSTWGYYAMGGNRVARGAEGTKFPLDENGRHLDGSNLAFADGHVKWLHATSIAGGPSNLTAGDCGNGEVTAANTSCTSVAATFSIY